MRNMGLIRGASLENCIVLTSMGLRTRRCVMRTSLCVTRSSISLAIWRYRPRAILAM